jgi:hypothetical protein
MKLRFHCALHGILALPALADRKIHGEDSWPVTKITLGYEQHHHQTHAIIRIQNPQQSWIQGELHGWGERGLTCQRVQLAGVPAGGATLPSMQPTGWFTSLP